MRSEGKIDGNVFRYLVSDDLRADEHHICAGLIRTSSFQRSPALSGVVHMEGKVKKII